MTKTNEATTVILMSLNCCFDENNNCPVTTTDRSRNIMSQSMSCLFYFDFSLLFLSVQSHVNTKLILTAVQEVKMALSRTCSTSSMIVPVVKQYLPNGVWRNSCLALTGLIVEWVPHCLHTHISGINGGFLFLEYLSLLNRHHMI